MLKLGGGGIAESKVKVILDTESQRSYILKSTTVELGFEEQREEEFYHSVVGGTKTKSREHKCYKIYFSSLDSNHICKLDALEDICNYISRLEYSPWICELSNTKIYLNDTQAVAGSINY